MSGWIINIDGDRPNNWEIAKHNSVWATPKQFGISAGDDLFFWETKGGGLMAHAVASEDARPVSELEGVPWPDHAERHYVSRFDLAAISETSSPITRSWKVLQEWGEFSALPNRSVLQLDSQRAIERLRTLMLREVAMAIPPDVVREVEVIRKTIDARRFIERAVVERRGQSRFRHALLNAYSARCCISRCDAEAALEAAHITPYLGDHTNTLTNGLLLRADLHTLFDLYELTIDASTRRVHLSAALKVSQYSTFDGGRVVAPKQHDASPSSAQLMLHNQEFESRHNLTRLASPGA